MGRMRAPIHRLAFVLGVGAVGLACGDDGGEDQGSGADAGEAGESGSTDSAGSADETGESGGSADGSGSGEGTGSAGDGGTSGGGPGCEPDYSARRTFEIEADQMPGIEETSVEVESSCDLVSGAPASGNYRLELSCTHGSPPETYPVAITVPGDGPPQSAVEVPMTLRLNAFYYGGDVNPGVRPRSLPHYAVEFSVSDTDTGDLILGGLDSIATPDLFAPLALDILAPCGMPDMINERPAALEVTPGSASRVVFDPGQHDTVTTDAGETYEVRFDKGVLYACCHNDLAIIATFVRQ